MDPGAQKKGKHRNDDEHLLADEAIQLRREGRIKLIFEFKKKKRHFSILRANKKIIWKLALIHTYTQRNQNLERGVSVQTS